MRKGFTLIELMIVIIIIGILATVGIVQYQAAVEKSRGAEAKAVLGFLNQQCASIYMETGDSNDCANRINLGAASSNIPNTCVGRTSHWFSYGIAFPSTSTATITATRCIGGTGKPPSSTKAVADTLVGNSDYSVGSFSFTAQNVY